MPKSYNLPRGIVKACAGIVESATTEPYITYITLAECMVGQNYALTEQAQENRRQLVEAVKFSLTNRRDYPFEQLRQKYSLPICYNTFGKEKKKFCYELARLCGFINCGR